MSTTLSGEGLQSGTAETFIPIEFVIKSSNASSLGADFYVVKIAGPEGDVPANVSDNGDGSYKVSYTPTAVGEHSISVSLKVPVMRAPADHSKTKVHGVGVDGPVVQGQDAPFTIEACNKLGDRINTSGDPFVVTVTGPHEQTLDAGLKDNGDGTYSACYKPVNYGEHVVTVTLNGEPVANSPYKIDAKRPAGYPAAQNSYAEGPGLVAVHTAEPGVFTIHAIDADGNKVTPSANPFVVTVTAPNGDDLDAAVTDNKDGTYGVQYQPTEVGQHTVVVGLKNPFVPTQWEHIKDSPFSVAVTQGTSADKTLVYGPGVEDGKPQDNLPTHFTIESRDPFDQKVPVGGDDFAVKITGPNGDVPAKVTDNSDGTYNVEYSPEDAGAHKIEVTLRGKPVAKSPYTVNVREGADHEKSGVGKVNMTIQARTKSGKEMTKGGEPYKCVINDGAVEANWKDLNTGKYRLTFAPKAGEALKINITVNGKDIQGSPANLQF